MKSYPIEAFSRRVVDRYEIERPGVEVDPLLLRIIQDFHEAAQATLERAWCGDSAYDRGYSDGINGDPKKVSHINGWSII